MAQDHDLKMLKTQARNLRAALARNSMTVTHAQSLELLAQSLGLRDWNTLHAQAAMPKPWAFGAAVAGRYLGQPFTGRVVAAREQGRGHHALTIDFDRAVNVSRSAHFTALRKRVTATVNPEGRSLTRTSDGTPHLDLAR